MCKNGKFSKHSTFTRVHKVDFEQGDISEDFGAKNYYAPKMFWLPIFSTFLHRSLLLQAGLTAASSATMQEYKSEYTDQNFFMNCELKNKCGRVVDECGILKIRLFDEIETQLILNSIGYYAKALF